MISRLEKEILMAHALGLTRAQLLAKRPDELDPNLYQPLLDRRAQHEPTAYITGHQPFTGLDFYVDTNVLIPRPETELLVEEVIKVVGKPAPPRRGFQPTIVDLGTGSGCIAVTLAKYLPGAKVIGIDSSKEALNIALRNAQANGVEKNCCFLLGDLFSPLKEPVDIIVSNPPYIPTAVIETLEPEVKDWEPRQALDGGKDGLDFIRKIISEAPNHLTTLPPLHHLYLELGAGQGKEVAEFARKYFEKVELIKDYAGIDRILKAQGAYQTV